MAVKRIAICNFKGGVGKTVLSVNLAAGIARRAKKNGRNYRVLLVDADAQANSSTYVLGWEAWERRIYPHSNRTLSGMIAEAVNGTRAKITAQELIAGPDSGIFLKPQDWPTLALLPAHYDLARTEELLKSKEKVKLAGKSKAVPPHALLANLLEEVEQEFDYVIVDCPPNIYQVARNALYYADDVIVPVIPDWLSVSGLTWLILTLGEQFQMFDQQKHIRAIVPTMVSSGNLYRVQMEQIAKKLHEEWKKNTTFKAILKGCEFWDTAALQRSVDVAKAVEEFRPVTDFARSNKARAQFEEMVDLLLGVQKNSRNPT